MKEFCDRVLSVTVSIQKVSWFVLFFHSISQLEHSSKNLINCIQKSEVTVINCAIQRDVHEAVAPV